MGGVWDFVCLDFFDGLFYLGESSFFTSIDIGVSLAFSRSAENRNFGNQYEDDCRLI